MKVEINYSEKGMSEYATFESDKVEIRTYPPNFLNGNKYHTYIFSDSDCKYFYEGIPQSIIITLTEEEKKSKGILKSIKEFLKS